MAMRHLLLASLLLLTLDAGARAACVERKPEILGATQGYIDSLGNGECLVDIQPSFSPGALYRSYAFFDTGLLMVFNSYGEGANSATTGSREYYFFPRSSPVGLKMDAAAGTIQVTMANGDEVSIDSTTAQIRSSSRGEATVSPRVDPANLGGVEFPRYDGLMLDTGYSRGGSAADKPERQSTFRSAYGQLCRVANREIFAYADGDHSFKFNDAELSAFLKKRCPALHAGF